MSEQTSQGDSQPSIEDRIEAQLFGDEPDEAPVESEDGEQAEEETEAQAEEPEAALETVEYEGKQYQVPPELKEAVLRKQDYTVKTQEVAELRRSAEAQAERLNAQAEFDKAITADREALSEINSQLKQYRELDWTGLDTDGLLKLQRVVDQLKERKAEVEQTVSGKRQQFDAWQQQTFATAVQATEQYMSNAVPGWGPKAGQDLTQYLSNQGYGAEAIRNVVKDPVATLMSWKAQQYDKAKGGAVPAKGASPVVKPGASNPELSGRMQNLNFRKQISQTKSSRGKADLIQKRLERMV